MPGSDNVLGKPVKQPLNKLGPSRLAIEMARLAARVERNSPTIAKPCDDKAAIRATRRRFTACSEVP